MSLGDGGLLRVTVNGTPSLSIQDGWWTEGYDGAKGS
jgi:glucan phosphorylase